MAAASPFERVVFDCDSTLTCIEGIDELAGGLTGELRAEVAALTTEAMEGRARLEEVYGRRLARIAPTRDALAAVGRRYVATAVPDARRVVDTLRDLRKEVHVVSGGLLPAVAHFAEWLGVPRDQVHAVDVAFAPDGAYRSYDEQSPLARHDGKADVLRALPPRRTAFVGDGMTDLLAREAVDLFVCFGGVVLRAEVAARADAVVRTPSLAGVLAHVLTSQELDALRGADRPASRP